MFTPLVQGKESRILEGVLEDPRFVLELTAFYDTERLIVPGRFRAHTAAATAGPSRSNTADSPTVLSKGIAASHRHAGRSSLPPQAPRTPTRRRRRPSTRIQHEFTRDQSHQQQQHGGNAASERTWLLRPSRDRVETWLDAWWKRWLVLVIVPSVIVSFCLLNRRFSRRVHKNKRFD